MSVKFLHPEYEAHQDLWRTARDVLAGDVAMKAAAERYVPRLEGMSETEYRAYVDRGFFYNATARTASGFLGMIFRKEPETKFPESGVIGSVLAAFANDTDLCGTELSSYARDVVSEVATIGRAGTLVDWNADEDRAYLAFYRAEDILNWREERIDGRLQLTLVVLKEVLSHGHSGERSQRSEDRSQPDDFGYAEVEQYRVLRLVPFADGWRYAVELWRDLEGKLSVFESSVPLRRGKALPAIPFVFHGPSNAKPAVERSPMADIIAANLDHYKMTADFKHGMHYTALPTAWVAGFDKDSVLRIGASTAWVTDQLGATAGYLEFRGEGLRTFERALDRSERLLAVLGARLLESQRRVSESAEALSIRQAGDSSVIAGLAEAISKSLNHTLSWVYWWHSTEAHPNQVPEAEALISLNTDFDISRMSGKEIEALVMAWQSGAFSHDTLLYRMAQGEVLPPGRTPEEEKALIKKDPPPVPVTAAVTKVES